MRIYVKFSFKARLAGFEPTAFRLGDQKVAAQGSETKHAQVHETPIKSVLLSLLE